MRIIQQSAQRPINSLGRQLSTVYEHTGSVWLGRWRTTICPRAASSVVARGSLVRDADETVSSTAGFRLYLSLDHRGSPRRDISGCQSCVASSQNEVALSVQPPAPDIGFPVHSTVLNKEVVTDSRSNFLSLPSFGISMYIQCRALNIYLVRLAAASVAASVVAADG